MNFNITLLTVLFFSSAFAMAYPPLGQRVYFSESSNSGELKIQDLSVLKNIKKHHFEAGTVFTDPDITMENLGDQLKDKVAHFNSSKKPVKETVKKEESIYTLKPIQITGQVKKPSVQFSNTKPDTKKDLDISDNESFINDLLETIEQM